MAGRERWLVDVELVRINGSLDNVLAEAECGGDEHDITKPRFGIEREHHA